MVMGTHNYYEDRRFCSTCRSYVRFLLSPNAAYCTDCGGSVRLFSPGDLVDFRRSLSSKAAANPIASPRSAEAEQVSPHAIAE